MEAVWIVAEAGNRGRSFVGVSSLKYNKDVLTQGLDAAGTLALIQEDDLLLSIMRQGQSDGGRRLKWNDIAVRVSAAGTVRKGKQCR